ncbi:uncharacterized protein LOC119371064 [Jatropha curcas]|uniref:uncharacterized protein LOC119371064 n=1 Tax=Jatropha curcas TaxID=180498 RepID=UPI00189480C0|nr:uncharacterized protein LOC119371064 [Jatropha curcas]
MCGSKKDGGMGFRDLHCFNMAMLAKQGWRLLTSPNTLFYRVLKSKYFRDGRLLDAQMGQNPSFVWRGIMSSNMVLKHGVRGRVGNGRRIYVVKDPWLPIDGVFYVEDDRISTLFLIFLMLRRVLEGEADLHYEYIHTILDIPLSVRDLEDELIWHYDKKGNFSVKSYYYLALRVLGRGEESIEVLKQNNNEKLAFISYVAWSVWDARNKFLWQQMDWTPLNVSATASILFSSISLVSKTSKNVKIVENTETMPRVGGARVGGWWFGRLDVKLMTRWQLDIVNCYWTSYASLTRNQLSPELSGSKIGLCSLLPLTIKQFHKLQYSGVRLREPSSTFWEWV